VSSPSPGLAPRRGLPPGRRPRGRAAGGRLAPTDDAGELFGIAELCSEFGITLRTIRFYEDKGLLARGGSTARASTRGATARGWR
jgi:hypothetical protein